MKKTQFSAASINQAIQAVRSSIGQEKLFAGNCGSFAVALAKWIAETMSVTPSFVGLALCYDDDTKPMHFNDLNDRGMNHVFVCVQVKNKEYLFDGEGLVSDTVLDGWCKQTWYDCGPGYDKEKWLAENINMPNGVALVFGDLSDQSIKTIEDSTAYDTDWMEFLETLQAKTLLNLGGEISPSHNTMMKKDTLQKSFTVKVYDCVEAIHHCNDLAADTFTSAAKAIKVAKLRVRQTNHNTGQAVIIDNNQAGKGGQSGGVAHFMKHQRDSKTSIFTDYMDDNFSIEAKKEIKKSKEQCLS